MRLVAVTIIALIAFAGCQRKAPDALTLPSVQASGEMATARAYNAMADKAVDAAKPDTTDAGKGKLELANQAHAAVDAHLSTAQGKTDEAIRRANELQANLDVLAKQYADLDGSWGVKFERWVRWAWRLIVIAFVAYGILTVIGAMFPLTPWGGMAGGIAALFAAIVTGGISAIERLVGKVHLSAAIKDDQPKPVAASENP